VGDAVLAEARELAQLLGEIASRDGHAEDDLMAALVLAWIGIASALVLITLLGSAMFAARSADCSERWPQR